MNSISVRHNIEVAHRLFLSPGKCENIHGHSMWVELEISGEVDSKGILAGLDFSFLKSIFRTYLDTEFDHRLLLNQQDPWANAPEGFPDLPGLALCKGDPTTENLATWIGEWMLHVGLEKYPIERASCRVAETAVNFASWWGGR